MEPLDLNPVQTGMLLSSFLNLTWASWKLRQILDIQLQIGEVVPG